MAKFNSQSTTALANECIETLGENSSLDDVDVKNKKIKFRSGLNFTPRPSTTTGGVHKVVMKVTATDK
jgi:hypothetical protein